MANPEHLEVVKQGAAAIEQFREEHPEVRLLLDCANLSGAIDGHDLGTWLRKPATSRGAWDAMLEGAIDVPRGADRFPKAAVVTALCASCGCRAFIIVAVARGSIGCMEIGIPDR